MAELKSEEEWRAAVKTFTEEAHEDKEFEDTPKGAKADVVVGSEEEKLLVEAAVATIQRQLPEICKNDPDVEKLALVYLRFREYAVVDAVARLGRFLELRASMGLHKQTTLNPTLKSMLLDGTRVLLPGTDKEGRALMVMTLRHNKTHDPKLLIQVIHWVILKTIQKGATVQKKGVTCIIDMEGSSFKNIDATSMKEQRPQMMKCFPIRMAQVFIVNPTSIVDVLVSLFKIFSAEKVAARITVVKDLSEIHQHVDKAQLPPAYGGTLSFDFKKWVDENNV